MKFSLGIRTDLGDQATGMRLARVTMLRLVFLSILLAILGRWHLRQVQLPSLSMQIAVLAVAVAFALAGAYAVVLRTGKHLRELTYAQLVFDQMTWTVLVYVSGGATSGATSLYGLSVLTGAFLGGLSAATVAAGTGYFLYGTMCLLMIVRVLPQPPDQLDVAYVTRVEDAIYPLGLNLLVLVVVTLLAGYLAERLRITGGQLVAVTERAAQAERLAYLGRVAAALAHEIRNPLGSISASIELLRETPALSADDRRLCEIIGKESLRLNDLVEDMLNLTRHKTPDRTPTRLDGIAKEVVELAARLGRTAQDVEVKYESLPGTSDLLVNADPNQVRQLVWNLVRNGVQATAPGTCVTVRTGRLDDSSAAIEVHDQGEGIPLESKPHLFDAFFTTRSHGTGIGLAVVKRIVDDHGWSIDAFGNKSSGTTFRVIIPNN